MNTQLPERLSVSTAAGILGLSRHTLRAWLRARRLPFHRLGRRIVLSRTDVEAYLARHRVEAKPESTI